jgi:FkbM family methyltransferase
VVTRALVDALSSDSIFFDVGSNVGFYTALASQFLSSGAVHAFEMDPRLVNITDSHFDLNDVNEVDVYVICAAVSDRPDITVAFTPHQRGNKSTNSVATEAAATGIHVPTVTLDTYCAKNNLTPDVLKIDVEGFESSVLNGGQDTVKSAKTLFLEVHPSLLSQYNSNLNAVIKFVRESGYEIRRFTDHHDDTSVTESLVPVEAPNDIDNNCMLYCTR